MPPFAELAWEYLSEGGPNLAKRCGECLVKEETQKPEEQCLNCKFRKLQQRFSWEFRAWLDRMIFLYDIMTAGWKVNNDDLSLEEWETLARIRQWYRLKELEAMRGINVNIP